MKSKKQKCKCYSEEKGEVKLYFCPKCRSGKVGPIQGWRNALGLIPRWRCDNCGFENMTFPIIVANDRKLNRKKKK